jgi:hypothetical protein
VISVAAATVFGPGLAVMLAFGVRERLVLLGAAPSASVGVALIVASVAAMIGRPFGPASLVIGTLALVAGGLGVSWLARRYLGPLSAPPSPPALAPRLPALTGVTSQLAQLAGLVFVLTGAGIAVQTWYWGLGSWNTYNQDHDPILHSVLIAYIQRTGRGAPWQIMPADVLTGRPTVYYPDGFHLIGAIVADASGDAVVGMNGAAAMLIGAAWTTSAGALAALAVRWLRDDAGWVSLGGGVGSVIAAGLYRPGLVLARDNGVLPNAAALVLVPGVVTAILLVRPRAGLGAIAVGIACAGIVTVHPSAGLSVGLSVLVLWLALLCTANGRATLRAQWPMLLVLAASAAAIAAPVLRGALAVSGRIEAFPPDTAHVPLTRSLGQVVPLVYGGMFDDRSMVQMWPTTLLVIGLAATLVLRRAIPILVVWAIWVVIVMLAYRNPTGVTAPILGFFYNSVGRLQCHVQLFAPALATLGVFGLFSALFKVVDRVRLPPTRQQVVGALAVLAVFAFTVGYINGPTSEYERTSALALSQRWSHPQLYRVDAEDIAAANWLRGRVQPGQRIMNSPNDGSTWLYVHDGLPVVELSTLGVPGSPYTWQLMKNFRYLGTDPTVRRLILALNIAWVYVDSRAPIIGADGAPDNWTGGGLMTTVPGLDDLEQTPDLILAHVVGAVQIYKVDLAAIRKLDSED